ncbi:MAG: ABC transporter ATP-binding protein [Bacillota bacterium]
MGNILEMRGITKRFGPVVANDGIDLEVREGEIHALLGENGAGKTTLMNILYGLYQPDAGEIRYKGQPVTITDPNRAIALGIGMVHQHFMLIPPFTVAENIVLGHEPGSRTRLDRAGAVEKVRALSQEFGLKVDPTARVENISVGMQQRVEILKALYRGAELLILDEPTAVLTPQEVQELIGIMRRLVQQGRTIIFITHKLKEVLRIADRVTVIRQGRNVATLDISGRGAPGPVSPPTEAELAALMVGRAVSLQVEKGPAKPGEPVLEVEGLECLGPRGLPALKGVSLTLRAGEILGIAGVDGNGQTELVECLTGLRRPTAGRIRLRGQDITRLPVRKRFELGLAHIPEDRQKRGLVLDFTVAENAILGRHYRSPYCRLGAMAWQQVTAHAQRLIRDFDIRPPLPGTRAGALSGGNQQKLIVAREIDKEPVVLIAAQPTRGVDVGAIEAIHRRLVAERDRGRAVLLVSLELDEILALSDRIAVMYEGRIVAEMPAEEATEETLGLLMAGGSRSRAEGGVAR